MKEQESFQGSQGKTLDDFFKNALKDYQVTPSESTWKGISRKLLWSELVRFNFTNVSGLFKISGIAAVSLLAILMIIYLQDEEIITSAMPSSHQNISTTGSATEVHSVISTKTGPAPEFSQPTTTSATVSTSATVVNSVVKISAPVPAETNTPEIVEYPLTDASSLSSTTTSENQVFNIYKIRPLNSPEFLKVNKYSLSTDRLQSVITKPVQHVFYSAGFDISPEITAHDLNSGSEKEFSWWTNLGITAHVSRFTATTGVSYGYSTTEAKYSVNYRTNDSIGYFTTVVSFTVDPQNPDNIIFNTKNTAVYDSVDHLLDDRARARYSYLRVPLLIGFDMIQTSRFNLNLRAGPAVTFMISEKKAEPYIDYPDARIIRIDEEEPSRIKTGWQVWTGLHMEYQFTPALSIYAEPSFRYYLDTKYINNEVPAGEPWSAGIGVGIQYNFGKKTGRK